MQPQSQTQSTRPRSKLEEVMQKEKAMEKQKAQRAASAAAFSSKASTGRKDEPWLVTGIVVKVPTQISALCDDVISSQDPLTVWLRVQLLAMLVCVCVCNLICKLFTCCSLDLNFDTVAARCVTD